MKRVVVTGSGIISAIGAGKAETVRSILKERSGIKEVSKLDTIHKQLPVGEVNMTNDELALLIGAEVGYSYTRTELLGIIAAMEAMNEAGFDIFHRGSPMPKNSTFISGTTVGGMDVTEQHYLDYLNGDDKNSLIASHSCGSCTNNIADYFGGFSRTITPSTACSSALNAIILGCRLIKAGLADAVVAGGTEALTKFHLNGFNSLKIVDTAPCRPFDATRAGLNLGEGAAYLVLESEEAAAARGAKSYAYISGTANRCDAFHQTATSENGEGPYLAMTQAIKDAGLTPSDINYINAHGTATPNNDATEMAAFMRIFGNKIPPFSSTKSFTGHTTSASGSIEAVICLLGLRYGVVPKNLNFSTAMQGGASPVSSTLTDVKLNHILCNSFGFGGNDSSIVISKL